MNEFDQNFLSLIGTEETQKKEESLLATGKPPRFTVEGEAKTDSSSFVNKIVSQTKEEKYPFLNVLPTNLKEFILIGAKQIDGPEEILFTSILSCVSVAIGNVGKLEIKKGWIAKPITFTVDIAPSSASKTPMTSLGLAPLYKIQKDKLYEYQQALYDYENDLADYEAEKHRKDKKIPSEQRISKPKKPVLEQIIVQDTTVEALRNVLESNKRGILIHSDEISGFLASMDQYKGGKGNDKQQFLQFYNGGMMIYNRGKEQIMIEDTFLSIIGGIQNDKVNELINDKNSSDGFVQRFILNRPETDIIRNQLDSDVEGYEEFVEYYDRLINELYKIPLSDKYMKFTDEAKTMFSILNGGLKEQSRSLTNSDFWKSLYGKFRTLFPRLCIILHGIKYANAKLEGNNVDFYLIDEQAVIDVYDVWLNYFIKQWDIVEIEQEQTVDEKIAEKLYKLGEKSQLKDDYGNKYVAVRDIVMSKPFGKKEKNQTEMLSFYLDRNPHVGVIISTDLFSPKKKNYYQYRGRPQND